MWLCDHRFADLPRGCRHVNQVVEIPKEIRDWRPAIHGLGKFDAAFDLQGLLKSAIPVALSHSDAKFGYHWQREGSWLFSSAVLPRPTSIHVVDQYIDVTAPAGGDLGPADFGLRPTSDALESITAKLEKRGWNGNPTAVFNCGAGWSTKRWPAESYARLADFLAELGLPIIFVGTAKESEIVHGVQAHMNGDSISMAGETSISELVALLSLAKMHVAGDTGSIHIAAALGTACVGIYTLTNPARSCPYGQLERCRATTVEEAIAIAQEISG